MRRRTEEAMPAPTAQRTLVRSTPELWAEVSDAGTLARHLGAFGDIRITRTEPETAVAWEGDRARGTVTLEPAGWGTRVTLEAQPAPPPPASEPPAPPRRSLWARLLRRPAAPAAAPATREPPPLAERETAELLAGVLDHLGTDSRRPFSR